MKLKDFQLNDTVTVYFEDKIPSINEVQTIFADFKIISKNFFRIKLQQIKRLEHIISIKTKYFLKNIR